MRLVATLRRSFPRGDCLLRTWYPWTRSSRATRRSSSRRTRWTWWTRPAWRSSRKASSPCPSSLRVRTAFFPTRTSSPAPARATTLAPRPPATPTTRRTTQLLLLLRAPFAGPRPEVVPADIIHFIGLCMSSLSLHLLDHHFLLY